MTTTDHRTTEREVLEREAQDWLVRLTSGAATAADAQALELWCRQSPTHAEVFAEANLLWNVLGPAAQNVVRREGATSAGRGSATAEPRVARRAVLACAMAASAAGYLVARRPLALWPSWSELAADYRTGVGEQRQITLAADVVVEMNTRTSLAVRSTTGRDGIELIAGEVAIAAAPTPFEVIAADGRTIVRSAKANVRRDGPEVCVTCLDGEVRVEQQGRELTVQRGRQVLYGHDGLRQVAAIDPAAVAAWRRGMLVFHNDALARVIEEVNRYRVGKIVLMNAQLGRRPIEASFRLDRIEDVITLVREAYGARVIRLPGGLVLLT